MRYFLIFVCFALTSCASAPRENSLRSCNANGKPWPVHPGHFYDGEIHLVPSFTRAPKGYKSPNFMSGYAIVFIKPDSTYHKLGLRNGDVILAIDDVDLDQTVPPNTFQRIKERKFENLRIDRCLEIKNER
jgi:hypothetical protein